MSKLQDYWLMTRKQIEVNTDPQRRCYNGCHFSSELVWTEWERLYMTTKEDGEASIKSFKSINPSREYKLVPVECRCNVSAQMQKERDNGEA